MVRVTSELERLESFDVDSGQLVEILTRVRWPRSLTADTRVQGKFLLTDFQGRFLLTDFLSLGIGLAGT